MNNMKHALTVAALNVLLVSASFSHYQYFSTPKWWFSNSLWPLPAALVQANKSPDGTVEASIGHSLPYTLRVNVTELAVTNATDENNKKLDNAHIVATTFDLTYTGDNARNATNASISANSDATILWMVAYNYDFPTSVLDDYDFKNPGDCSKPLGAACVSKMEQFPLGHDAFTGLRISAPECADTLGGLSKAVEDDLSVASITNNAFANVTNSPVLWLASGAFSGRDQNALDAELGKLQLVGVTTDVEDTKTGAKSTVNSVMCFRIDKKIVQSAAPSFGPGMSVSVGAALLTGLAVGWIFV